MNQKIVLSAVAGGIIWGTTFYFIRKGLNKRNFIKGDPVEKRTDYYYDAIYGGLAASIAIVANHLVATYIH